MEIKERIAAMASAINHQTSRLATDTARQIRNVWICEDGEIMEIEDSVLLNAKVEDDKKKLDDMLRIIDELMRERDGSEVSDTVLGALEGRDGSDGDALETEQVLRRERSLETSGQRAEEETVCREE